MGCTTEKDEDTLNIIPTDLSNIKDFKCVCSSDHKTEFVIEGNKAKELYTYLTKQWRQAEEVEIDRTEQKYVYLMFQDGEPLFILSKDPKAEISDALAVSDEHFYGAFWIYENTNANNIISKVL